ncbi:aldo/keto reductase [Vannielia litorea]|uniref:Predicted oxidoreductase n=1 Tax=Vannielia litorea TaxID=1217970 RepID=A0A1N6E791_9RHOB|nr:aldo/keto reductase [Vannielia litorea]SIN78841.1 Predicted oxidoreductase [Vannielia litorea]
MKKRKLGAGGPEVSAIGLGCMSFAGFFGDTDLETSVACLDTAWEAGIDFLDTANIYGMGRSESAIGAWLKGTDAKPVIATKASIVPKPQRHFRNDEDHLRSELEQSLKRLGVDSVGLFYAHRREQERPVEELAETMARLMEEGLIGGYGLSEVAPSTIRRAHAVKPVMAVQNEYSLWSRQPELGVIQTCAELGVAFVPFSPLARGELSDTVPDPAKMGEADFRRANPRWQEPNRSYNQQALDRFRDYARSRGVPTAKLAMAWVLGRGDHLIPIPGTRTGAHLKEWVDAADMALTTEDYIEIEKILPVGFAHGDRYSDSQTIGVERYC